MPKIPYIPQATPITVTIDGHWDGMHNGNEPYMTYLGHDGQTRRVHIPHGAYVQTNPEEAPDVAFTVDKTPKHPHDYSDVTDTGEPLDAERCGAVSLGLTGDRACMLPPDGHLVHEAENGLQWRSEDTPRKPEYGDRGPKIGDTVAVPLNDENGTIIVGSLVATYDDKFWIEGDDFDLQVPHQGSRITVIEPARPAVPEEPAGDVCVMDEATTQYVWDERPEDGDGLNWRAEDGTHYTWEHLWEKFGPLYRVERGPAISG